ncbi:MAG: ATP-binding protein [bacterium]
MKQVIKLKNDLDELKKLAKFITEFVADNQIAKSNIFNLNLILEEHIVNIISYAYDDNEVHEIEIVLNIEDSLLEISVIDDGKPFDPTSFNITEIGKSLEETKIGGLGILFITQLTNNIEYKRNNKKNNLNMLYNIKM